jgi:hypothetical protein
MYAVLIYEEFCSDVDQEKCVHGMRAGMGAMHMCQMLTTCPPVHPCNVARSAVQVMLWRTLEGTGSGVGDMHCVQLHHRARPDAYLSPG